MYVGDFLGALTKLRRWRSDRTFIGPDARKYTWKCRTSKEEVRSSFLLRLVPTLTYLCCIAAL